MSSFCEFFKHAEYWHEKGLTFAIARDIIDIKRDEYKLSRRKGEKAMAMAMMKMTGESAMQAKMREVFQGAGKALKFWKATGPGRWIVLVDGKKLGERIEEAKAFQEALDKSGIGGTISYKFNEKKGEWDFKYSPKKEG